MNEDQSEADRAFATQLTEEHIQLVALRMAVETLLALEARRDPTFLQSARAALDAALGRAGAAGILAETDQAGFVERIRAEFQKLLASAEAVAESAKGYLPEEAR
jgi:hypothetical protein